MAYEQGLDEAEALLQERSRQIAALPDDELKLLLDTAAFTLSCRRHAESPGEGAAAIATDFFAKGDEGNWLELFRSEADGAPAESLDLSDPEHFCAQLSGHDLGMVIMLSACALSLRQASSPAEVIDDWIDAHQEWEPGMVERLEGLTRAVWQARQMLTIEQRIAEHGYTYTYVMGEPAFCYTTGLWQAFRHPELFLYGLSQVDALGILGGLITEIRERSRRFTGGEVDSELFNLPVGFVEIPKDELPGRLNIAAAFYGDLQFEAVQVLLSDAQGVMPWQTSCDPAFAAMQPLLGVAPD